MSFPEFLIASPTSYHASATAARMLSDQGFRAQNEADGWDGSPGGHFIVREGAIIAYRLPAEPTGRPRFHIVGTHTDSPSLKLKPHPEHESARWAQAGMEIYGGPLLNSWLDREFGLAGRVVTRDGSQRLIQTGAWLRIPQLAPHLDRSVNDNLHLDQQRHMMPVYALASQDVDLMTAIAGVASCEVDDIVGHDLFAYITQPPEIFGLGSDFLASGRLDNLSSVYPGLIAMMNVDPAPGVIPVLACFDHEEVGSQTRTGAAGPFLDDVLTRIGLGLGWSADEVFQVRARSQVVSADAGHSVHPNYPQMYDPDERPLLGSGVMLKVNARQRYSTDGPGEATWLRACAQAGVACQSFVSNNSVSCGTTIGPITATRLGIPTVDVGLPILSMHSAREMCSLHDVDDFAAALEAFLTL
ncbi:MAG: M18 family aminopeptidase [Propionibacteriaceae bacterium]|jgi:aspartyl aminopeptidase|nr:M18 family aminopeptidase [Propionibacteriaceae bacterium]